MLKSMKQKFSAGGSSKQKESGRPGRDDVGSTSVSSSKSGSMGKGSASRPGSLSSQDKPPIPILNEQNLVALYSDPLPPFRDVPTSDKQHLFVQKLHLCAFVFDFGDPTKRVREKEMKRQTLLEIVDYANTGAGKFTESVSEDIVFMIGSNLFRTLPPPRTHDQENFDAEEEEPSLDPSWPHLQVR
eukprot:355664-Chlamydomonas_euryale.AAC.5